MILIFTALPILGVIIGAAMKRPLIWRIFESILSDSQLFQEWFGVSSLWLVAVVCLGLFLISLPLIWRLFKTKPRRIATLALALILVIVAGATVGVQAYKNSFIKIGDGDVEIALNRYMPFGDMTKVGDSSTQVKTLDDPSTLKFTDNLPLLDGATALYPLYAAFVRATYPEGDYNPYYTLPSQLEAKYNAQPAYATPADAGDEYIESTSPVVCRRTAGAFDNLVYGYIDIAFLMDVSPEQAAVAEREGVELQMTPIGKEAFVFLVNSKNRMENLSQEEVRGIYSGVITNWREVGGANDRIEAYQRREGSGSQTALQKIMGGTPIMAPKENHVYSFTGGLYNAVARYKNYKNAIGYSFRFYIEDMLNDAELNQVKLLSIDGVAPAPENIRDGAYPFGDYFYAVTVVGREPKDDAEKSRLENTQRLIDWILSEQGQELVEKTGYVTLVPYGHASAIKNKKSSECP
jgi:phosphate transport system substrate-binding protein